ncbi:hypothetical protein EQH57_0740 [Dictyocoela roeselum]|nr:hypothetical protein EQH57_0740 [Dictyocoela roeselum]
MSYELPYACPFLSPRFCMSTFLFPCVISSLIYKKLFNKNQFSFLGLLLCPFVAYGTRRYVINRTRIKEGYKQSMLKSICFCNSFVQDLHEMSVRKIGLFRYHEEPEYYEV